MATINSSENSDLIVMNLLNTNQPNNHNDYKSNYHGPKIRTKTCSLSGTSDHLISCIHKLFGSGCIRTTLFSLIFLRFTCIRGSRKKKLWVIALST